jgi:hypothetical protein
VGEIHGEAFSFERIEIAAGSARAASATLRCCLQYTTAGAAAATDLRSRA